MAEVIRIRLPEGVTLPSDWKDTIQSDDTTSDLVVLKSSELNQVPDLSGKPIYVLLEDDSFQAIEQAWKVPGVIGCGQASGGKLPSDIAQIVFEMSRRRVEEEKQKLPVVTPDSNPPPEGSFVTLTLGRMRRFMADLNDALQELAQARKAWGLQPDPFLGISKAEWLDAVYACYRALEKEEKKEVEELRKRIFDAITTSGKNRSRKKNCLGANDLGVILDRFGELFGWSSRDAQSVPGYPGSKSQEAPEPRRRAIPSLLIEGETGTGKTLLANYIRARLGDIPFRQVTCTNIPDNLLESELFGSMAGAFTDSKHTREGKVLAAYGGVVFFDEIGDLPLGLQVKLLALLNEGLIYPDGWHAPELRVPVVIVAATNRNLPRLIKNKQFRDDLYYRFDRRITVPPLRQRLGDLERLVAIILGRETHRPGAAAFGLSRDALAAMKAYAFPGNFRELENVLKHAVRQVFRVRGTMILPEDLCFEPLQLRTSSAVFALAVRMGEDGRREVLLGWNEGWGDYHFIGGRTEAGLDGNDSRTTIRRVFKEKTGIELAQNVIARLGGTMETMGYSGETGDRTWHRFQFFKLTDAKKINECFRLTNAPDLESGLPAFVAVSDADIAKGFVHYRRISESVQECWQRLSSEGLLELK